MAPSDSIDIINDMGNDNGAEVPMVDGKNDSVEPLEATLVTDTPVEKENKDGVKTDEAKPEEQASKPEAQTAAQPEEKAEHESPVDDAAKVTIESAVVESSESCKPSVVAESGESCKPENQVGQKVETASDASVENEVKVESTVVASGESATISNAEEGILEKAQAEDVGETESKPENITGTESADKVLEVESNVSSIETPACKSPNKAPMDTSSDTEAPMNKTKAKEASPDEPGAKKTKQLSEMTEGDAQIGDAVPECLAEIAAQ
jgi:hypothetical protein